VLDDIRAAAPDLILNLGDTVWGAADPAAAWALQAEFAPPSVRGNTDERVAGLRDGREGMREWLRSQLPPDLPARLSDTDSVCFVDNPERRRVANSTPGTRFSPTRIRSD
jgi:hypothetical protein